MRSKQELTNQKAHQPGVTDRYRMNAKSMRSALGGRVFAGGPMKYPLINLPRFTARPLSLFCVLRKLFRGSHEKLMWHIYHVMVRDINVYIIIRPNHWISEMTNVGN